LHKFAEVGFGFVIFYPVYISDASAIIRQDIFRIDFQSLGKKFNGCIVLFQLVVCNCSIAIGLGVIGIDFVGLDKIGNGSVYLPNSAYFTPLAIIRLGIFRV